MKVGDTVGGYELLKSCGRGAFGEVFLAKGFTQQQVALKVIELNGASAGRELQALRDYIKCCPHESLMTIHHAEAKDTFYYYTMDLADNLESADGVYVADTLKERLDRNGAFTVQETTDLAVQILNGLIVLHSNGLIHRDIKPANILWIRGQAKLGDIGLLAHDNSMTCQAGTPGFMPPPNLGIRTNSPQLDLYALAQVLYCCLTGGCDADPDDLDISDDLQKNGKNLFQTINLVCQRNSPIKTAEQFLESVRPQQEKCKTVTPEEQSSQEVETSGKEQSDISSDTQSHEHEPVFIDEKSSVLGEVAKIGLGALATALIPGGLLSKGVVASTLLGVNKVLSDLDEHKHDDLERKKRLMQQKEQELKELQKQIERQENGKKSHP